MTVYDDYGMPVGVTFAEPESLPQQTWRVARGFAFYRVKPIIERRWQDFRSGRWREGGFRRWFTLVKVCVVVWWVVVYWGERTAIPDSIDACRWDKWEKWDADANPHRLVFVADPQLIDPHTYPGRPWPLDSLTMIYVDMYIRRAFSRIQRTLYPDSVVFLGDLFDGGREWSTRTTKSPEERYRKYGEDFWLKEYKRFGGIFFEHWRDAGMEARPGQPGRKMLTSLPGNHDLGFAKGVQIGVRNRFHAYFGEGNRIDILGNHTFVSIDSVSLSAKGQSSPETVREIWQPTTEFLDKAKEQKKRLVQRELRVRKGLTPYPGFIHRPLEADEFPKAEIRHADDAVTEFPTILLSHVPLYREQGTPCGPLRERYPPTPVGKGEEPLEKDDRNAISVSGGYQYQNVLNPEITAEVAEKVGNIQYAFSGDDHDYCELLHYRYASAGGGIREITVKSISWCMGIRHPGVVLASMWNPVDEHGKPLNDSGQPTLQTHLCLLPDQLGIFIRYVALLGVTLLALSTRAALIAIGILKTSPSRPSSSDSPLLPLTATSSAAPPSAAELEKANPSYHSSTHNPNSMSNSSSSSDRAARTLQVRTAQARTRSVSPANGYGYALPTQPQDSKPPPSYYYPTAGNHNNNDDDDEDRLGRKSGAIKRNAKNKKGVALFWDEFRSSVGRVALFVFAWYFWLLWGF
ncbi:hypothetical protein DM02DRAFT_615711 [Periconia macrospinosa]|uniref:Uncharacterized protein n=1 Tax=Periconia macrospinosa TaxID=97972 RepID=A0A2V1DKZ0_9PLEO|nr:hypothetical protein DM02DRAFT_615711 [Periconia macrospinosa]